MNLLYIGAGFVGSCSAAVSANSGHKTLIYDIDGTKIEKLRSNNREQIESCLYEDGLADLLIRHQDRIDFTTDYQKVEECLDTCDAVFLCLPTPEIGETGESDLTYYTAALEQLSEVLVNRNSGTQSKRLVIINKSTVPIDTVDLTETILKKYNVKNVGVVSNPEFLVEGKAILGSFKPDRVVVGAWKQADFEVMRQIYQRFYDSPTVEYIEVNPKEAAAGKLLANYYLFNKLAVCFDVIGRTCETFADVQFENIRKILTSDNRIGSWGFYNSLYAGGSCFIKDARSLSHQLQTKGHEAVLVNETYLANKRQLELFLSRAEKEAAFDWKGKIIALLGTAFKRDTNDIRNSPSIDIVRFLQEKQVAEIRIYDPSAREMFKTLFSSSDTIQYVEHEMEAIASADCVIVVTDWPQFRGVPDMILGEKHRPLIMDGRRMLQHRYDDLVAAGCSIIAVGSSYIAGK